MYRYIATDGQNTFIAFSDSFITESISKVNVGSGNGGVVQLLASNMGLATAISEMGYLLLISPDMTERLLKRHIKSSKQPYPTKVNVSTYCILSSNIISIYNLSCLQSIAI